MCININKGDDDRTHSSAEQMNDEDTAADSKASIPTYHQFYYYYRTRYGTLSNKWWRMNLVVYDSQTKLHIESVQNNIMRNMNKTKLHVSGLSSVIQ